MAADIVLQRLTHVAKHQCACVSPAKKTLVNTSKFLSASYYSTHTSIPDFLLPAFSRGNPAALPSFQIHPIFQRYVPTRLSHAGHRRSLSTSPAIQAVVVMANPRKDVDGNEMLVDITTRAANVCGFSTFTYFRWSSLMNDSATQRDHGQRRKSQPSSTSDC